MASRYDQVLAKYDWAKKHIKDFEAAVDSFRRDNPHAIGRQIDDQTGEIVYYVKSVPIIPDTLSFMLGDVVHNLRSTLDHLTYALIVAATGGTPHKHTSFPIFDTPEAYIGTSRSKVPGLREYCYEILDRVQPYKGGWGHSLWQLHQLDIVDKHRLLLSIASVPVGRTLIPSEESTSVAQTKLIGPTGSYFRQMLFAAVNPTIVPMQTGYELARFPAFEENENVGFTFDIAIDETEIMKGMPTFLYLRNVSSQIFRIIESFALCL